MKSSKPPVFITFDLEEFDLPIEYGHEIDFQKQIEISETGTIRLLKVLEKHQISSTFFTTANFAIHKPELVKRISLQHEIASHSYFHSAFQPRDILQSKTELENITGQKIVGFRMPRLASFPFELLADSDYLYDSSMNPTWIPGRYNHWNQSAKITIRQGIHIIPSSVSNGIKFPLFWLSFKNMPLKIFAQMCINSMKKYGHLCLYFHPWEFADLHSFHIPGYIKKIDGEELLHKLEQLLLLLKESGEIVTIQNYLKREK